MITVRIKRTGDSFSMFQVSGHSGYAESGYDIYCAAVSVLALNTVNSIEVLCKDRDDAKDRDGFLSCRFPEGLSEGGKLLMNSMIMGLEQISEGDGKSRVKVIIEEVQTC